jgi:hypothetical protein
MISRSLGVKTTETNRNQGVLEVGSSNAISSFHPVVGPQGNHSTHGLTSLSLTPSTANATTNGLPLNMLVDAAMAKVSPLRGTAATSTTATRYSNQMSHGNSLKNLHNDNNYNNVLWNMTTTALKRGVQDTNSTGVLAQLKNRKRASSLTTSFESHHHNKKPRGNETTQDNPVLMQRLSELSGGFPMPKWGALLKGGKGKTAVITQEAIQVSKELDIFPSTSIGAFPMPRAKEEEKMRLLTEKPVLTSFQQVWDKKEWNGDLELQKEVLARKLQRGSFLIDGKSNKMLPATARG